MRTPVDFLNNNLHRPSPFLIYLILVRPMKLRAIIFFLVVALPLQAQDATRQSIE